MASKERRELIASFYDIILENKKFDEETLEIARQHKENLLKGNCGWCGQPIDETKFKDQLSYDMFVISHCCQSCLDEHYTDERKQHYRSKNGKLLSH